MVGLELAGLALGGLGSALSIGGQKKAAKASQQNWMAALAEANALKGKSDRAFAGQMGALGRAKGALNTGFDQARTAAASAGTGATLDIQEGRQKSLADLKGHLLDTGGYSSALYSNAVRGTSASATRQLAKVREMVAGLVGGIESQRGGALASVAGQEGNAWQTQFQNQSQIAHLLTSMRSQFQPVSGSGAGGWGAFLGSLGGLLGKAGGGADWSGGGGLDLPTQE